MLTPDQDQTTISGGDLASQMRSGVGAQDPATRATTCDCEIESISILNLCRSLANGLSSPTQSQNHSDGEGGGAGVGSTEIENGSRNGKERSRLPLPQSFLSDTLKVSHILVQHWGAINGCSTAEAHFSDTCSDMLCSMTDAIELVLRGFEAVVRSLSSSLSHQQQQQALPPVSVGVLVLEPSEAAIVVRESLKHSVIRLSVMLQDIEEEAALLLSRNHQAEYTYPLQSKDVKGLVTRLFRLLGSVNNLVNHS